MAIHTEISLPSKSPQRISTRVLILVVGLPLFLFLLLAVLGMLISATLGVEGAP